MGIPEFAVLLAGFVLGHAAWSVSDLPKGQLLVPLAIVEKDGQRQLLRFEAETQVQAITNGKTAVAKLRAEADAWAFAREGQFKDGDKYVDIISVNAWAKGMAAPITFVRPFQPFASGKFKVLGEPWVVIDGKVQSPAVSKQLISQLQRGIQSHSKAAEHWSEWQTK
jgi:hypothetical protein